MAKAFIYFASKLNMCLFEEEKRTIRELYGESNTAVNDKARDDAMQMQ